MRARISKWLDELVRWGVVKSREDVINAMIVVGCILAAAGLILLVLAWAKWA